MGEPLSELLREELLEMARAGVQPSVIAEELQIAVSTVYKIMKQYDVITERKEARDNAIVSMYLDDASVFEIMNELDISSYTLYKVLQKEGVELRRSQKTNEDYPAIIELYEAGVPVHDICRQANRSTTYIYKVLDECGVPRRQAGSHWEVVDRE